jgi:hypothetical protein
MKSVIGFALLIAIAPGIASGATPDPAPSGVMQRKVPTTFRNPGHYRHGQSKLTGAGCIGPRVNAAQAATNPITGRPQAAPIVAIPIGGGSIASATNRAQQNQACIHPH